MKDEVVNLCQKYMENLYLESKKQLLDKSSYNRENIDIKNVRCFFTFLEEALKKPYNRLHSLNAFINNDAALGSDLMYPFCNLSEEIKHNIEEKDSQAIDLATGLDSSGIDLGLKSLCGEKHKPTGQR